MGFQAVMPFDERQSTCTAQGSLSVEQMRMMNTLQGFVHQPTFCSSLMARATLIPGVQSQEGKPDQMEGHPSANGNSSASSRASFDTVGDLAWLILALANHFWHSLYNGEPI